MGNSGSSDISSCLLTEKEFLSLRKGDRIDHRDFIGMFAVAEITKVYYKQQGKVRIHYVEFPAKYDVDVDYYQSRHDVARARAISQRKSKGALSGYGKGRPVHIKHSPSDASCGWIDGVITNRKGGQVQVKYLLQGRQQSKWVHLDNEYELRAPVVNHNNNNNNNRRNNRAANQSSDSGYHNHGTDGSYQYQQQQQQAQAQMQRQDQMTVRTQLLLDDTEKLLQLTRTYLDAANARKCSQDQLSIYNQKVVTGLTCFKMKVSGMSKNAKKEGIDFSTAFKSSLALIKIFENDYRTEFGDNAYLMQRLEPCLNYMRSVLVQQNVPSLPYVDEYEFDAKVASSVISGINHAQNHVIPDRMQHVNTNNKQYKAHQQQLQRQYEQNGQTENVHTVNINGLTQDYNSSKIAFGQSKQVQQQRAEQDLNALRFQEPDLVNDGFDDDHDCQMK
eukprot:CAMPEP_0202700172 /NCGR_PEP_ID=MMETSP1385-20130828/13380_1 /ASSEMBLY_ACC=CAM_ASM_000861 /TAXON_ID=933848 /ORGANISM="Elphidium margaritaceum" /LENGTH=445 /DNA_ID=CAMNT_0049357303 /DNA_START=45 /DNA_END=1382 /DNA_ORIENTATION=+